MGTSGWGLASGLEGGSRYTPQMCSWEMSYPGSHYVIPMLRGVGGQRGEQLTMAPSLQTLIFPMLFVHFKGVGLLSGPPAPAVLGRVGSARLPWGTVSQVGVGVALMCLGGGRVGGVWLETGVPGRFLIPG